MSDRELLDLAARAAGYEIEESMVCGESRFYQRGDLLEWNPLTDDGDALRLAVTLCMRIDVISGVETEIKFWSKSDYCYLTQAHSTDSAEATRRAITRAAAEIGGRTP